MSETPTTPSGPKVAPLSREIPATTPAQDRTYERILKAELTAAPPTYAPTTEDPRARARVASSPRRLALARTLRQLLAWSIVGFALVAIVVLSVRLLRAPAPPRETVEMAPATPPSTTPRRQERATALVREGDSWLPRDPARAEQLFRDALTLDPTNAAANFGLGVTLLQREATRDAVPYLCAAHRTAVGALRSDVHHLLDERAIDCP